MPPCFQAHISAVPAADWPKFAKEFVESLGLVHNPYTTQVREAEDTQRETACHYCSGFYSAR